MVSVKDAAAIPVAADTVRLAFPVPGTGIVDGERAVEIPLGAPLTDKTTAELNR